jgi:hypothetical protein
MSSIFRHQNKPRFADLIGYALSAASLAMILYILIEGWVW